MGCLHDSRSKGHHNELTTMKTQDQLTAHHASTYIITCMDFRLLDDVVDFMDALGFNNNYDQFIVAGASLGLVQTKFPHWGATALDHMEIGLSLHAFRDIMIIDHEDCGAYKKFMPYNNKEEEVAVHTQCLQEAYNMLGKRFPKFGFKAYLMDLHGKVKEIAIDKSQAHFESKNVDNEKAEFLSDLQINK
jgi:carbonic anhydrase